MHTSLLKYLATLLMLTLPGMGFAADAAAETLNLTNHWVGFAGIAIFILAYLLVMAEEFTHLRKSKPVLLAAGIIWALIAIVYNQNGLPNLPEEAVRHNILEYAELMLFLLVAMTYISAMEERLVFDSLRSWLINKGYGFRKLFWMTGTLAFFISPIADNLTTALIMCAVVLAVGGSNTKFVSLACINIVVGANAGGAFSPFGDITTLMVWQKGTVDFQTFFALFLPAAVNYLVPASVMHFSVPDEQPEAIDKAVHMKHGAKRIIILFLVTIATAVSFHNFLHLPPMLGMMTGLAYLKFFAFYLKKEELSETNEEIGDIVPFDIFDRIARAEWDTLMFFFGVILCVGGLGFMGYLSIASDVMYNDWGATSANITVGLLSAIVDNIPVMFAVLTMQPDMSLGHWLLVTLTTGVGGSLLSIGSAAGVALMGQARGKYTFFGHLKWTPVIALGYLASIGVHFLVNGAYFNLPANM